jgi:predicted amidohydrolase
MSRSSDNTHTNGYSSVSSTRVAAVQLAAQVADVDHNLQRCDELAREAISGGAQWVILPEFFTTGVAFDERLAHAHQPHDGAAAQLMAGLAREHGVTVGGSFLCRDDDAHVRNAFLLFGPDGGLLGRHDKDLPTMWENCFYVGGADDGVIDTPQGPAGVALCWELIRSQTARRLRERVAIVVGGSCWWTIPAWPPRVLTARMEQANERNATRAAPRMARLVGAPVVHAAHCGRIECAMPWAPLRYRGRAQGGASVSDAYGRLLAFRDARDGEGVAVADVRIAAVPPAQPVNGTYWLVRRGPIPALAWEYQRAHGRRWYRDHASART